MLPMNDESLYDVKIYQLRIYIRRISPLIWRRILVRSDSTIADLHYTLQLAFGWTDYHLHQFKIRGKSYGIAYAGGISFSDDPHKTTLEGFCFRPKERFVYEYNFTAGWELEGRVEKTVSFDARKIYPVCIGGGRDAPPEDCDGPWDFMRLKEHYSPFYIERRLIEIGDLIANGQKTTILNF